MSLTPTDFDRSSSNISTGYPVTGSSIHQQRNNTNQNNLTNPSACACETCLVQKAASSFVSQGTSNTQLDSLNSKRIRLTSSSENTSSPLRQQAIHGTPALTPQGSTIFTPPPSPYLDSQIRTTEKTTQLAHNCNTSRSEQEPHLSSKIIAYLTDKNVRLEKQLAEKQAAQQTFSPTIKIDDLTKMVSSNVFKSISRNDLELKIFRALETHYKGSDHRLNTLLIGPYGCGKSHLFINLASRILNTYKNYVSLYEIHTISIIRNCQDLSKIDSHIKNEMEKIVVQMSLPNTKRKILCMKDIGILFSHQNARFIAASFQATLMEHPNVQVIATVSEQDYDSYLKTHDLFLNSFQAIRMQTMDDKTTLEVLKQKYHEKIDPQLFEIVIDLSNTYFPKESNPLKCIRLIEDCLADLSLRQDPLYVTGNILWQVTATLSNTSLWKIRQETITSYIQKLVKYYAMKQIQVEYTNQVVQFFIDNCSQDNPIPLIGFLNRTIGHLTTIRAEEEKWQPGDYITCDINSSKALCFNKKLPSIPTNQN